MWQRKKEIIKNNYGIIYTEIIVNCIVLLYWILLALFQIYVFQYGHIPVFDVKYRHYDLNSLCWNNIIHVKLDYENVENMNSNCVYVNELNVSYKKCVTCRKTITYQEPTVFNQNYHVIVMCVITIAVVQFWSLYLQLKTLRQYMYFVQRMKAQKRSYEHYCDVDYILERQESKIKLLNAVSEGRKSTNLTVATNAQPLSSFEPVLPTFVQQTLQPSMSLNNDDDNIYKTPKPVYSVPKKVSCLCEPDLFAPPLPPPPPPLQFSSPPALTYSPPKPALLTPKPNLSTPKSNVSVSKLSRALSFKTELQNRLQRKF